MRVAAAALPGSRPLTTFLHAAAAQVAGLGIAIAGVAILQSNCNGVRMHNGSSPGVLIEARKSSFRKRWTDLLCAFLFPHAEHL